MLVEITPQRELPPDWRKVKERKYEN